MHFLHDAIGLKDLRHLFIQSEVKPKPIVTRSHAFSRALRQPHVVTSSFDWFNVLSVSYVIGQSNYFGFGFTTLKRKPLYPETWQIHESLSYYRITCNICIHGQCAVPLWFNINVVQCKGNEREQGNGGFYLNFVSNLSCLHLQFLP